MCAQNACTQYILLTDVGLLMSMVPMFCCYQTVIVKDYNSVCYLSEGMTPLQMCPQPMTVASSFRL